MRFENVRMCECVSVLYKCVNVLMRECALRIRKYVIFRIEYDFLLTFCISSEG